MALAWRRLWRALLLILTLLALPVAAYSPGDSERGDLPVVAMADLPAEARHTLGLIREGGPFPYQRDGVVFRNFERLLPQRERGYYREYTVATPGVKHRGARRIVAGRGGELYYTHDHYRTFKRIRE